VGLGPLGRFLWTYADRFDFDRSATEVTSSYVEDFDLKSESLQSIYCPFGLCMFSWRLWLEFGGLQLFTFGIEYWVFDQIHILGHLREELAFDKGWHLYIFQEFS